MRPCSVRALHDRMAQPKGGYWGGQRSIGAVPSAVYVALLEMRARALEGGRFSDFGESLCTSLIQNRTDVTPSGIPSPPTFTQNLTKLTTNPEIMGVGGLNAPVE